MEIRRFYVNSDDITDNVVTICGDEFWHLTKVLRYKVGYQIIVCNDSDGKDYLCTIDLIEKDYAKATVNRIIDNECKTKIGITLFQALPKGDKADLIVQKAVELGVQNIVFFNSDYVSEKKFNIDRLHKINVLRQNNKKDYKNEYTNYTCFFSDEKESHSWKFFLGSGVGTKESGA